MRKFPELRGEMARQDYVLIVTNLFKVDIFHIIALTAAQ